MKSEDFSEARYFNALSKLEREQPHRVVGSYDFSPGYIPARRPLNLPYPSLLASGDSYPQMLANGSALRRRFANLYPVVGSIANDNRPYGVPGSRVELSDRFDRAA